jgi:hypothetical protein
MPWQPEYITSTQLKAYKRIEDTVDDAAIAWAIATASRAIDDCVSKGFDRQFGKVSEVEERLYTPWWSPDRRRWVVTVDDFQTSVGLVVNLDLDGNGTYADVITGPRLLPLNAQKKGRPWEQIVLPDGVDVCGEEGEVSVTALWGWTTVPVAVELATALQASRLLARRNAPFGVAGSPESGTEIRLLAKVDADVAVALKDYVRRLVSFG